MMKIQNHLLIEDLVMNISNQLKVERKLKTVWLNQFSHLIIIEFFNNQSIDLALVDSTLK